MVDHPTHSKETRVNQSTRKINQKQKNNKKSQKIQRNSKSPQTLFLGPALRPLLQFLFRQHGGRNSNSHGRWHSQDQSPATQLVQRHRRPDGHRPDPCKAQELRRASEARQQRRATQGKAEDHQLFTKGLPYWKSQKNRKDHGDEGENIKQRKRRKHRKQERNNEFSFFWRERVTRSAATPSALPRLNTGEVSRSEDSGNSGASFWFQSSIQVGSKR